MSWLLAAVIAGVATAVALWVLFVYIAVRGTKTDIPGDAFAASLAAPDNDQGGPMRILVPIDGSAGSVAAIREVGHDALPAGSTIELLFVIHSRLPVIPDFPPWAVTIAAAHGETIREQTRRAPAILEAGAAHLRARQPRATVLTKTVEGVPKDEILREAVAWGADRITLGSHGRGRAAQAVLGATVEVVAARAPCTVHIARPRRPATRALSGADAA